jgi:Tol biopolymer transport system component
MLRFSLRQSILLWVMLCLLLGVVLLFGRFLPAEAQVLLSASDGVYLQQANERYYFFDESALPTWSPDGEFVALQAEHRFFLSDSASRVHYEMNLQGDERFVYRPVWSDDSQRIAVLMQEAEGSFRLLIVDCASHEVSKYDFPSGETVLLWWESSVDIRFVSATRGELRLWHYQLGNSHPEPLQRWRFANYMLRDAVLNPDKQSFILPAITTSLQNFELYAFDIGGTFRNISNRPTHNDSNPVWSPDGTRLAYRAQGDSISVVMLQQAGQAEELVGRFDDVFISDMQWYDNRTLSLISSYSGHSSFCSLDVLSEISQCSEAGMMLFGLSWRRR